MDTSSKILIGIGVGVAAYLGYEYYNVYVKEPEKKASLEDDRDKSTILYDYYWKFRVKEGECKTIKDFLDDYMNPSHYTRFGKKIMDETVKLFENEYKKYGYVVLVGNESKDGKKHSFF
jgi:hypothetical protein